MVSAWFLSIKDNQGKERVEKKRNVKKRVCLFLFLNIIVSDFTDSDLLQVLRKN